MLSSTKAVFVLNYSAGYSMNGRAFSLLRHTATVLGATLFLAGCAFSDEALLPSLTGEAPAGEEAQVAAGGAATAQPQPVDDAYVRRRMGRGGKGAQGRPR